MRQELVRAGGVVLLSLIFCACKRHGKDLWIAPSHRDTISISLLEAVNDSKVGFWTNGHVLLSEKNKSTSKVMVSFSKDSHWAVELRTDPHTFAFDPGSATRPGFAGLSLTHPMDLNDLAAAAHQDGFGCGRLEFIPAGFKLTTASSWIPPLYSELVPLSSLTSILKTQYTTNLTATITALESMKTRLHSTTTGIAATQRVEDLIKAALGEHQSVVEFKHVSHKSYFDTDQKSLITTLKGSDPSAPVVIVGAHLDSINSSSPSSPAPGADDDASGIATLVELLRTIAENNLRFQRSIEFHAYAAEEVGLIGSGHLAASYAQAGRKVAAMLQVDMNSYSDNPNSSTVHLIQGDTSPHLNRSVKNLLHTYLGGDFDEGVLPGNASSDHRSWHRNGFPAVFPFEDPQAFNKALHTSKDTLATINNLKLSERFVRMIMTFLAHYGGLINASSDYERGQNWLREQTSDDLKLAVFEAEGQGSYHIAVGTPSTIQAVELCIIGTARALRCDEKPLSTGAAVSKSGRLIYSTQSPLTLKQGSRIAVFGYDGSEKIAAIRTVRLEKKAS